MGDFAYIDGHAGSAEALQVYCAALERAIIDYDQVRKRSAERLIIFFDHHVLGNEHDGARIIGALCKVLAKFLSPDRPLQPSLTLIALAKKSNIQLFKPNASDRELIRGRNSLLAFRI